MKLRKSVGASAMEFAVLNKRLQEPWTAHLISRQLTPKVLCDMAANVSRYSMKVLLRVLISLLSMDSKRRAECADAVTRLLDAAASDEHSEWVRLVAAIVRMRLGSSAGDAAAQSLDETGDKILAILKESFAAEQSSSSGSGAMKDPLKEEPTFYFQPLELSALSQELAYGIDKSSVSNAHFSVMGKRKAGPQFLHREEERAAETRRRLLTVQPMTRQPQPVQAPASSLAAKQEKAVRLRAEAAKREAAPLRAIKKIVLPSKMADRDDAYGKTKQ